MRTKQLATALIAAALLAACGGGGGGGSAGVPVRPDKFSAQVTFGDSLSDVGTHAVGAVGTYGGGKYTINGDSSAANGALTGKNWTELMAAQLGLPAPCPAQTGLEGHAQWGFSVPVVNHPGCTGYAQGGARVSHPVGPENKATGSVVGQLTVPVSTQIANHLAVSGGRFKGDEMVFVMAGGNDALFLLDELASAASAAGVAAGTQRFHNALVLLLAAGATDPGAAAVAISTALQAESVRPGATYSSIVSAAVVAASEQPGNERVRSSGVYVPIVLNAQAMASAAGDEVGAQYASEHGAALVTAMANAGTELANLVTTQIVARGANYVVVNNLPDIAMSPAALARPDPVQALIRSMVDAFNDRLKAGVAGEAKILYVDVFAVTHDQATNPAAWGLTNTTKPACGSNALGASALVCNASNLVAGDVSHYMFADGVHPTPFVYALIARHVAQQMAARGWI